MSIEVPWWAILAGGLSHSKDTRWFRVADVHRVLQLHHAATLHSPSEHETGKPEEEIASNEICNHRSYVLFPLLDAQPGHHLLECVGEAERCELGQGVLHSSLVCVPGDRVSCARQQLPKPHHLLSHEEGI